MQFSYNLINQLIPHSQIKSNHASHLKHRNLIHTDFVIMFGHSCELMKFECFVYLNIKLFIIYFCRLNDVEFRENQEFAKVDKIKIVACDGKSSFNELDRN